MFNRKFSSISVHEHVFMTGREYLFLLEKCPLQHKRSGLMLWKLTFIGGSRGRPPTGSNFFVFSYVFAEKSVGGRRDPPPPKREILDPPPREVFIVSRKANYELHMNIHYCIPGIEFKTLKSKVLLIKVLFNKIIRVYSMAWRKNVT